MDPHKNNNNDNGEIAESVEAAIITEPNALDILCGNDKLCQTHEGSRRFRHMIASYKQKYQEATSKQQRMAITKEVFSSFKESKSRFIKFNEVAGHWEEITPLAARDKISHALRYTKAGKHHRRNHSDSILYTKMRHQNIFNNNNNSNAVTRPVIAGSSANHSKKMIRKHRRKHSDSSQTTCLSIDSMYSEATTECSTAGGAAFDGDFSFIDMLVKEVKVDKIVEEEGGDNLEPIPLDQTVLEPLPINQTVDLSFMLQGAHIWDFEGDNRKSDFASR